MARGRLARCSMTNRNQSKRLALCQWLLVAAFAALAVWLMYLQGFRHEELKKEADANTRRKFFLEPRRGDILDAKHNLLATSVIVKTVCADPQLLLNHEAPVARAVAPLLQVTEEKVRERLFMRLRGTDKGEVVTNHYVVLKRQVPVETWQRLQQTMSNLTFGVNEKLLKKSEQAFYRDLRQKAIFADPVDEQLRVYPNQALAAHVLGYVGTTVETNGKNRYPTLTGLDGIERTFNTDLRGVRGWRLTEIDHRGRERVDLREQNVEAHDGLNVVLTIDSVIQHITEEALAEVMTKHTPISASVIVLRPRTGEILALATLPNFDPNDVLHSTDDQRRDRLIADIMEPGSTFKVVVVSGALNEGLVRLSDLFFCENGAFGYAGRTLHDHEKYATLSVEGIITKSSNIGAAKIGIKMGEPLLYRYILDFGFAERTGIPLPGEVRGIVHPTKAWKKVSIAQIPMGQGVAVTPIQMAFAVSAIANRGQLMRPMLVDRLENQNGQTVLQFGAQPVRQVVSETAARQMVQALKTVVSPEGTAAEAALDHYTVAGKTGTAQKAGRTERGTIEYLRGKYFSSFIGFFPADAPELCIAVFLDEPKQGYYGGKVAAPCFKQIATAAANYLNIKPDLDVEAGGPDGQLTGHTKKSPRPAVARLTSAAND